MGLTVLLKIQELWEFQCRNGDDEHKRRSLCSHHHHQKKFGQDDALAAS